MLINYNPDDYVIETTHHTCEHHKRMPWDNWPGCTCSGSFSTRLATPQERAANIQRRKKEEERRHKHIEDYDVAFIPAIR